MKNHSITAFIQKINTFYAKHKRDFPWRYTDNPYRIVVSEIMLQQTQTFRVEPKYKQFIAHFPSFAALAQANQKDVFLHWQGLGYNRRALYLHQFAQWIIDNHNGKLPSDPVLLQTQKGIGHATARSICTFAFNIPTVFIETNIRAVFLHEFFCGQENIHDKQLVPLIEATVDTNDPRSWYYALMDYGVFLKATLPNPSTQSKHYTKQNAFEGSTRQIRSTILKELLVSQYTEQELINNVIKKHTHALQKDSTAILKKMVSESLIKYNNGYYYI